jgi:drug/metabolite transporter (DMT)-like permease
MVMSVAGALLVVLARHDLGASQGFRGELLMCGCVLSWATYTLLARKVLVRVPPLVATAYSTLAGMLVLVACAMPFVSVQKLAAIPLEVWAAGIFLGLFGTTISFTWFMDGVSTLGATRAGQFINLVPVFAVALSMLVLGERPSPLSLLGGLLVVGGLLVTQTNPKANSPTSALGGEPVAPPPA